MLTLTAPSYSSRQKEDTFKSATHQKNISEVEVLAKKCGGTVTRLSGLKDLIQELPKLGKIRVVMSNPYAIQGQIDQYEQATLLGNQGNVQGNSTCLCLLLNHWRHGFAVQDWDSYGKFSQSLQFFDRDGVEVYKTYLTSKSNQYTYKNLISHYHSSDQTPRQSISPLPSKVYADCNQVNLDQLHQCWQTMQDLQDLPKIFHYFGVNQLKGLESAGTDYAIPISIVHLQFMLGLLQESKLPVVFHTYNQGGIQAYQGKVQYYSATRNGIIILDTCFSLRIRSLKEISIWIIRKFKGNNERAVISLYDRFGTLIFQISSRLGYGRTTKKIWQRLLTSLEKI
ncbi:ChuX/HutX family heme-like substrate-binding protein [Candidatus Nitrosacidococcus sp. I8]|uniref:ChuX/HutX family heme-like substrate-binding protein n=1 Tax=Candidatus Nitrosacidococcus sp. I8 TaxID=2942908 RepID=UPI002227F72F|nr:ChuX/HutX family heme-like substrate-binding protein [Candidatus Nitrosacidococcus sp. I8]CAH9017910.1 Hemin transport protein HemS [Candidatus Nitrosacidococcus sp. I8]